MFLNTNAKNMQYFNNVVLMNLKYLDLKYMIIACDSINNNFEKIHLPFLSAGWPSSSVVDLDLFLQHRTQDITYVSSRTSFSYLWQTPKTLLFKEANLFPVSVESHTYFHIKEFFMLHKLAENSDISRREKSLMLEIHQRENLPHPAWRLSLGVDPIIQTLPLFQISNLPECTKHLS